MGVTAQESNTYTDFCLINLGGLTTSGEDATNDLTYIILDVIEEGNQVENMIGERFVCIMNDNIFNRTAYNDIVGLHLLKKDGTIHNGVNSELYSDHDNGLGWNNCKD